MAKKYIMFDFGDTLAKNTEHCYQGFYKKFLNTYGLESSLASVQESLLAFENPAQIDNVSDAYLKDFWLELYSHVLRFHGLKPELTVNAVADMWEYHLGDDSYVLFDDTIEALEYFSSHFTLGILSNFDSSLSKKLSALNIKKYFSFVYFSAGIGHEKPHPEAFLIPLRNERIMIADVLYVGDHMANDVLPCELLGIDVVQVCPLPASDKNRSSVRSLTELKNHPLLKI